MVGLFRVEIEVLFDLRKSEVKHPKMSGGTIGSFETTSVFTKQMTPGPTFAHPAAQSVYPTIGPDSNTSSL